MDLAADLDRIALQESRLRFDAFDARTAWELALALRDDASARAAPVAAVVETWATPLASFALPQREDHNIAAAALARVLGQDLADAALA